MRTRLLILAGVLAVVAQAAAAQPFWEKKEYGKWSKDECKKMLQDSPWSKSFTIFQVAEHAFGQPTQGEARQTEQKIFYYAQLRSVLPVRQAVVRRAQIENKYDKMPPEQQKAFDESAQRYLAGQFSDTIILHVEYETNVEFFDRALAQYWQSFPEGVIPQNVFLTTSKGVRIEPMTWKAEKGGGRAFEFVFPRRTKDGQPVVAPDEKAIRIEFPNPQIRGLNDTRAFFEFKLDKMTYQGTAAY